MSLFSNVEEREMMHLYGTQKIQNSHLTIGGVDTVELVKHMEHHYLYMIQR